MILESDVEQIHATFREAACEEFVHRLQDAYRFVHDRVQEAAYSLIPQELRAETHFRIGRLLLAHTPEKKREEAVFEIVSQLNRGAPLITSQQEREHLAELNLSAGMRAKRSTAYNQALTYFAAGTALLTEDGWERRHELAFELQLHRAECEFLTGEHTAAEERLTSLSKKTTNMTEHASVACLQMDLYTALDRSSRALAVGIAYLHAAGIDLPLHPCAQEARREYDGIGSRLTAREIEDILDLPVMSDPLRLSMMDVLTRMGVSCCFTDPNLLTLVMCKAIHLSIESGVCESTPFACAALGLMAGPHLGDYPMGLRLGRLGCALCEQRGLKRLQPSTSYLFAAFILPWSDHVRQGRKRVSRAVESAYAIGDLNFCGYSRLFLFSNRLACADPLDETQSEGDAVLSFSQQSKLGFTSLSIAGQLSFVKCLRGLTRRFGSFDDETFDESEFEQQLSRNPSLVMVEFWWWVRKLQARCFSGDFATALEAGKRAQTLLWSSAFTFEAAEYCFYDALAHAGALADATPAACAAHIQALAAHARLLELWTGYCPENFEHRAALVNAEIARIEGRELDAERLYEKAIESAHANGFLQNEGLAYERAADFYRGRGLEKFARTYLTEANACYARWGAAGKVRQLERLHPWLRQSTEPEDATLAVRLDSVAIAKAQRAISSEILLEPLARALLRIVMENAGAQTGYLAVEGNPHLRAVTRYGLEERQIIFDTELTRENTPFAVLNYVRRTRETLVLSNPGSKSGEFEADEYFRRVRPKSVLCMPIRRKDQLLGILCLENNLAADAFTLERRTVLEMLAAQAAISLETAGVHEALKASESKYRQIVATASEGICVMGPDDLTTFINPRLAELIGYRVEEMLGRPLADFLFGEDLAD
ncbi:MAG: GAF domain-containing protein, partial [Sinobacteraceae bacterium]|nr:GAF domain-containing protein [Nevskiaceae bacterium]